MLNIIIFLIISDKNYYNSNYNYWPNNWNQYPTSANLPQNTFGNFKPQLSAQPNCSFSNQPTSVSAQVYQNPTPPPEETDRCSLIDVESQPLTNSAQNVKQVHNDRRGMFFILKFEIN